MMRTGPPEPEGDVKPLGAPIKRDDKPDADRWEPLPGSPGVEVNTVTGKWRTNIAPPPVDFPVGITP